MFDKDNKFGFISNNENNNNIEGLDKVKTDINNIKDDVNELNTQYKDIAKQVENVNPNLAENDLFLKLLNKLGYTLSDLVEKLPVVNIAGDLTGISADNYKNVTCNFNDELNNINFTDYATIAYQGSGSLSFPRKNYKIKLFTDEARTTKNKRQFKDWHKTNNYHLKCNFGEGTNIMNNLMMHYVTKSYQYLTPLPRAGARYTVDGFPILLYVNNEFVGIYFWNLKQDDKVYNLNEEILGEDGSVTQQADLCYQIGLNNGSNQGDNSGAFVYGNLNSGSNAGKNFTDAHAEIDYYWEDRVWDKTSNHPDVLYNAIQMVSESSDEEFIANLETYFDKEYLINYFVIMYACAMIDSKAKNFNMLYFPDMGKWYATFWDMDYAFGTTYAVGKSNTNIELSSFGCPSSRLFDKLWKNFKSDIVAKYKELRKTLFTTEQVEDSINHILGNISNSWLAKNYEVKYGGTGYNGRQITDPKTYILDYANKRFEYMDTVMTKAVSIDCTNITLDNSNLNFTSTETQTLTASLEPEDTTDAVIWSSDDENIAIVNNGVVTPISNGSCKITAICGKKSATCNVVISGLLDVLYYEIGDIAWQTGDETENSRKARLNAVSVDGSSITTNSDVVNNTITHLLRAYDNNMNYVEAPTKESKVSYTINISENVKYIRMVLTPNSALTETSLNGLVIQINDVNYRVIYNPNLTYSRGYINDKGEYIYSYNDVFKKEYIEKQGTVTINVSEDVSDYIKDLRLVEYDSNKNFIKRSFSNSYSNYQLDSDTKYVRIGYVKSNNITIPETVLTGINIS